MATEYEPSPDQNHPPHVHRLLRLIREGTPSHASRASALLGRYAASCSTGGAQGTASDPDDIADGTEKPDVPLHPSVIIWDLIGRLVAGDGKTSRKSSKGQNRSSSSSGLFDFHWSTRSNCALALEAVARCLPIEDRRHFFEGGDEVAVDCSDHEPLLWLSVHDLHSKVMETRSSDIDNNSERIRDRLDRKPKAIAKVGSCNPKESCGSIHEKNQMDVVVERGRLLLASSGERYDWTDEDEEAQEYIREHQALQALDGTAAASPALDVHHSTDEGSPRQTFLRRRVLLQRQILARRLGLGGILGAPIVNDNTKRQNLLNDIVKDEELVSDLLSPATPSTNKRKATHSQGTNSGKGATKRKRKASTKSSRKKGRDDQDDYLPTIDIRKLLVAESNRASLMSSNISDNQHHSRNRNPQLLLSTEVAYRTFDPQWTVRHGALLATLSLLRAWKVHDLSRTTTTSIASTKRGTEHSKSNSEQADALNKTFFGKWPHDILARCICIIALDRFADFSGFDIEAASGNSDDVMSGAIVAPVRETAAQIIAILLEAAPPDVRNCTSDLLTQLYHQRCDNGRVGWEVRHGVLLVWKYVCVIARLRSPFDGFEKTSSLIDKHIDPAFRPLSKKATFPAFHATCDNIMKQSICGLSDESDDVRAVAAQVLLQMAKTNPKLYMLDVVKECSNPLWQAICSIQRDVSSCASDLLVLFATVLCRDFQMAVHHFSRCTDGTNNLSFDTILCKLTTFVGFNAADVRIACFQALCLITNSVGEDNLESQSANTKSLTRVLCDLVERLFHDFCEEKSELSLGDAVCKHRNLAWSKILVSLSNLMKRTDFDVECNDIVTDTIVTTTLRYFDVCKQPKHLAQMSTIELSFHTNNHSPSELVRAETSYGNDSFSSKCTSSLALSQFYKKVCSAEVYQVISLTIQTCLRSPWLSQCEASCLLHIAIVSLDNGSVPFFMDYLPYLTDSLTVTPDSLVMDQSSCISILRDPKVQSLCDNALATLLSCTLNSPDVESNRSILNNITTLRKSLFEERGVSFEALRETTPSSLTKSSMRLNASVSGAIVHCGSKYLPAKVSPLIRSLLTSLKSEYCERRAKMTCCYIARLIALLSNDPSHHRARNKLVENLCSLASGEVAESPEVPTPSVSGAQQTLGLLVSNMSQRDMIQDIPAIWDRLLLLMSPTYSKLSEEQQFQSILIVSVVSRALTIKHPSMKQIISSFVKPAVYIACNNQHASIKKRASVTITNLCSVDFDATMETTIHSILPILSDLHNEEGRKGGCELLVDILQGFSVSVSPYVITLLPVVMRLMTDESAECSRHGASAFAILVRIAPLCASFIGHDKETFSAKKVLRDKVPEDVIRHLILGKPLPPCELPSSISQALAESGTVLRPYQMEGVAWIKFLSEVHLNGALCDDMGLGKTLQSLLAMAISHCSSTDQSGDTKRSLVVCPSTVVGHWVGEIRRFFPRSQVLSPFDFTGPIKVRRQFWDEEGHKHNIVITSYSVLRTDIDLLEKSTWDYCILDEGHLLKNPKTATAKASRRIKANHKLILTGTPIQNNVHELWATFDFLMPNFLGSEISFVKEFARPIISGQKIDASASDINRSTDCLKTLHQQVLPFVLRREKGQVIKELPPKIITDIPCVLSSQQQNLYHQVMGRTETRAALDVLDISIRHTEDGAEHSGQHNLGNNVLTSLLKLRVICTHPILHSLFGSNKNEAVPLPATRLDSSGKLMALNDLLRHSGIAEPEITAADNDSSGLLLQSNDDLTASDTEDNILSDDGCIDDSIDNDVDRDASSPNAQSKCLIFAQFTQSLDIVEKFLFEPHMPSLEYLRLDGSVPSSQRSAIVERFNEDLNIRVLLLTTKVGGLGLNLTGADKVIFLEPDWNPFVDLQAMDRAHRIGQTKTVNVYRLITMNTIEEKILKLQQRKMDTANAVVNTENSTMYSMGTDRLLDIFTFRGSGGSAEPGKDDNVLSYLDDGTASKEYASLSVGGFLSGLS
eukprot:CCRYP_005261-RB/>CCRYP_005261-RB protein AED:0.02 eAED:0.02 QI:222/1/1/1/1/1/5/24/1992